MYVQCYTKLCIFAVYTKNKMKKIILFLLLAPLLSPGQIYRDLYAGALASHQGQGAYIAYVIETEKGWTGGAVVEVMRVKEAVLPSLQFEVRKHYGTRLMQPFLGMGGGAGWVVGGSYAAIVEGGGGVRIGRLSMAGMYRSGAAVGADFEGWYVRVGVRL